MVVFTPAAEKQGSGLDFSSKHDFQTGADIFKQEYAFRAWGNVFVSFFRSSENDYFVDLLANRRNTVSRALFRRKELTEFCGKLGEFCEKLGEFAFAHK